MHRFGSATPQPENSRASTFNDSPPQKRPRTTQDDVDAPPNKSARAPSMTPAPMSQVSGYDQILLDGEAQSKPPTAVNAATRDVPSNVNPNSLLLTPTITIRYGEKVQKCTVHLQLLFERSPKLRQLFDRAATLRDSYLKFKLMRQKAKALLPPETSTETFLGNGVDSRVARAMDLINEAYLRFPLLEYQGKVKQAIEECTDEQFQDNKLWKVPPSHGGLKRKDYAVEQVSQRLQLMRAEAVLAVLHRLFLGLWRIKGTEEHKAILDKTKAAAQNLIILPKADEKTIGSVLNWVYNNELQHSSADHLCRMFSLAEHLGLQELTGTCLTKLSNAANKAIDEARMSGVSLQDLLNGTPTGADGGDHVLNESLYNVVNTVFTFVLGQERPPVVLKHLVIDSVAKSADPDLVETLLRSMAGEAKDELCMALSRRLFKLEQTRSERSSSHSSDNSTRVSVKSEAPGNSDTLLAKGQGKSEQQGCY